MRFKALFFFISVCFLAEPVMKSEALDFAGGDVVRNKFG
jgi:hypothetical protein